MSQIINILETGVPHSTEAERCLLAAFILAGDDRKCKDEIIARVSERSFFLPEHGHVFAALAALHRQGRSIDLIVLKDELNRRGQLNAMGGLQYLAEIMQRLPSASHWQDYLRDVHDFSARRFLIAIGDRMVRSAHHTTNPAGLAADAAKYLTEFVGRFANNAPSESPAADLSAEIEAAISGNRRCLPFPWPALTDQSKALRPASQIVFCGSGGASKSIFIAQALEFWHAQNIPTALFTIEDDRVFTLFRILAQLSQNADLTDPDFIRKNAKDTRAAFGDHFEKLDSIGRCIWDAPDRIPTLPELAAWVRQRAEAGDRIIIVDPVSRARVRKERHLDDDDFTGSVASTARKFGCSVILVTHPVKGPKTGKPTLDDIAGGAAYARFAQVAMYLQSHEPAKRLRCLDWMMGLPFETKCNRELSLLKTRSAGGTGKRIGFDFRPRSLTFHETGIVMRDARQQPAEEAADE